VSGVTAETVAWWVDALLWFAAAMSGTGLHLLLLSCLSWPLIRRQQLVLGLSAAMFHAVAGILSVVARRMLHAISKPR